MAVALSGVLRECLRWASSQPPAPFADPIGMEGGGERPSAKAWPMPSLMVRTSRVRLPWTRVAWSGSCKRRIATEFSVPPGQPTNRRLPPSDPQELTSALDWMDVTARRKSCAFTEPCRGRTTRAPETALSWTRTRREWAPPAPSISTGRIGDFRRSSYFPTTGAVTWLSRESRVN